MVINSVSCLERSLLTQTETGLISEISGKRVIVAINLVSYFERSL
ncbi:hypothetical protein [Okeania sp. SIO3I5]|nr:hypothetical protein [Okeania sp. SIO3I5]